MRAAAFVLSVVLFGASATAPKFFPARFRGGEVPPLPQMTPGGGEVFLQVTVDPDGRVGDVVPLRATPPFTALMIDTVRGWQFMPALDEYGPVASDVFVAGVFRPPALYARALGEPPRDLAASAADMPFPITFSAPAFPPHAFQGGVTLLEAEVGTDGRPADVRVIRAAPPFDEISRTAVHDWVFRAARVGGGPVRSYAYVIFGFSPPVTGTPR
jgi:hypothetical protein